MKLLPRGRARIRLVRRCFRVRDVGRVQAVLVALPYIRIWLLVLNLVVGIGVVLSVKDATVSRRWVLCSVRCRVVCLVYVCRARRVLAP